MKKTIAALFVLLSAAVFAGANDLLIMFYTPGPDKYADGSVVLDGERYSLVYTAANGEQTSVLTVSIAKDGKCPPVLFSVDEKEVAAKYVGGSWGVYLLDTRDFAKDAGGKTLSALDAEGQPTVVNVKATVGDGIASAGGFESAASSTGVAAGTYDLANIPQPKVAGIKVDGANVIVTVKDTEDVIQEPDMLLDGLSTSEDLIRDLLFNESVYQQVHVLEIVAQHRAAVQARLGFYRA